MDHTYELPSENHNVDSSTVGGGGKIRRKTSPLERANGLRNNYSRTSPRDNELPKTK